MTMKSIVVTTASPVVLNSGGDWSVNIPMTVTAVPGAGGTLLVQAQTVDGGSWVDWDSGSVSSTTSKVLNGPVYALRFTATTANGVVEIGS